MATVSQFAAPSGPARRHSNLRVAPLRWASEEPPKLATASQFAAPRGGEAEFLSAYDATPLDPPGAHEHGDSFVIRGPQGRRGLRLVCV